MAHPLQKIYAIGWSGGALEDVPDIACGALDDATNIRCGSACGDWWALGVGACGDESDRDEGEGTRHVL